ncbi:LacI family transcriptional regulator [candidate division KSB1 bacterium]|nr:MAG: LacI family transcriptional regulator [candidate division KSB1 bacterium]NUM76729.1 LacI family DNA-binding transcriptional regulator [candidate division KSB1 bacterium]
MSARLLEIAQQTGFSVSTVSRVLHDHSNKYKISAATKALIRKAAEELGYRPNKLARGLRLNQTHEIGVIVPDISNPFFATLVKSIAGELRKSGYSIFVYDADENTAIEAESIKILLEKKVDGLIIASVGQEANHLKQIETAGVPWVMVDRCFDRLAVDAVSVDNFRGAYLATQYLIREGHRLIAFIQGLSGTYVNEGRLQGYKQALQESNLPLDERLIVGDDFRNYNGYLETKLLLKLQEPPTAIFTAGDLIAMGALEALKEDHYRVPQDVSLITFDDPSFATYLSPALTTVAQPVEKMGEMAVKLLFRRLRAPNGERRRILLEPRLIVRDSVMRRSSLALVRQAS